MDHHSFADDEQPLREYFCSLYERFWQRIYRYCLSHLRDEEQAKEVTQEIFFALWERRHSLAIRGQEENYLIRAAKYKVFDHYRQQTNAAPYETATETAHAENLTENQVYFNALVSKINELVLFLPGQCRKVYELSRENGLSNKEIASSLQISPKAVEYHITRALRHLREHLPEYSEHFSNRT